MFRLSSRASTDVAPLVARVGAYAILQETPAALMVLDADGTIVHRNRAGLALGEKVGAERGAA
ncbi:MAG TPA: PAS domain-containing protein, partial [Cellulomonadaceae bacterium]|nr:PAS domain-containing protein [Cellulomonadaceae bacterium]